MCHLLRMWSQAGKLNARRRKVLLLQSFQLIAKRLYISVKLHLHILFIVRP